MAGPMLISLETRQCLHLSQQLPNPATIPLLPLYFFALHTLPILAFEHSLPSSSLALMEPFISIFANTRLERSFCPSHLILQKSLPTPIPHHSTANSAKTLTPPLTTVQTVAIGRAESCQCI